MTRTTREDNSHYIPKANPWGASDGLAFIPHTLGLQLRCPGCSNLWDSVVLEYPGKCTKCGYSFTDKKVARDMCIEAEQVKVMGGWTHERIEALKCLQNRGVMNRGVSGYVAPDNTARPINDVARNVMAWKVARDRRIQKLRNSSGVDPILRSGPFDL